MSQADKARHFASLHVKGDPVVLYNIWDAGTAKAVAEAGAVAVATGSWSVAAAQGYPDGQHIPLDLVETLVQRIVATVDIPLTVDFEGGYAEAPDQVAENAARMLSAGAVGLNFEDQVVGGEGLHGIKRQQERIAALRAMADAKGVPAVINARTDLFLKEKDPARHSELVPEALERGAAFAEAGADSFFVPGLVDRDLIEKICDGSPIGVNIMKKPEAPSMAELKEAGVARVSFGPIPYFVAMAGLADKYREALAG